MVRHWKYVRVVDKLRVDRIGQHKRVYRYESIKRIHKPGRQLLHWPSSTDSPIAPVHSQANESGSADVPDTENIRVRPGRLPGTWSGQCTSMVERVFAEQTLRPSIVECDQPRDNRL